MARDAGGGKAKRGRLFDDLSVAQVVAGALAAVTSMLLASQIGIYGSVIGVGVGSVVSAVASQLYKKFFTASAEKLRELKPGETGYVPPAKGASDDAGAEGPDPSGWTAARHAAGSAGRTATLPQSEKTARLSPQDSIESREAARRSRTPRADDAGLRDDPTVQRARERREHRKKLQRRVVAVSIASAIVAVALSALVIDLVTTGQGVGAKTQPLIPRHRRPRSRTPREAGMLRMSRRTRERRRARTIPPRPTLRRTRRRTGPRARRATTRRRAEIKGHRAVRGLRARRVPRATLRARRARRTAPAAAARATAAGRAAAGSPAAARTIPPRSRIRAARPPVRPKARRPKARAAPRLP